MQMAFYGFALRCVPVWDRSLYYHSLGEILTEIQSPPVSSDRFTLPPPPPVFVLGIGPVFRSSRSSGFRAVCRAVPLRRDRALLVAELLLTQKQMSCSRLFFLTLCVFQEPVLVLEKQLLVSLLEV